jgi:hypothetical protein
MHFGESIHHPKYQSYCDLPLWGGVGAGENRAPILVMAGEEGVLRRYLDEGITIAAIVFPLVLL